MGLLLLVGRGEQVDDRYTHKRRMTRGLGISEPGIAPAISKVNSLSRPAEMSLTVERSCSQGFKSPEKHSSVEDGSRKTKRGGIEYGYRKSRSY